MVVWQLSEFSFELTIIRPLGSTEVARVGSQLLDWIELSDILLLKLSPILNHYLSKLFEEIEHMD